MIPIRTLDEVQDIRWSFYNVSDIIRRMTSQIEDLFTSLETTEDWLRKNGEAIEDLGEIHDALIHSSRGHATDFAEVLGKTQKDLKRIARTWRNQVECPYDMLEIED